jgi:hypothetical protein
MSLFVGPVLVRAYAGTAAPPTKLYSSTLAIAQFIDVMPIRKGLIEKDHSLRLRENNADTGFELLLFPSQPYRQSHRVAPRHKIAPHLSR